MILPTILSLSWIYAVHRLSRRSAMVWPLVPAALIAVCLAAQGVWQAVWGGYAGDSFWTLGWFGRMGVIVISGLGIFAIFRLIVAKSAYVRRIDRVWQQPSVWILDTIIGMLIYAVIYSISPQVYYSFYKLIFPNIPNQIVISSLLDVERVIHVMTLSSDGTLSAHLAGIGIWAVIPFTSWQHLKAPDPPNLSGTA